MNNNHFDYSDNHFVYVKDGKVYGVGSNVDGELGFDIHPKGRYTGPSFIDLPPKENSIINEENIIEVACCHGTTVFLSKHGYLLECGKQLLYKMGYVNNTSKIRKMLSHSTQNIKCISCGFDFVMALDDKGKIFAWAHDGFEGKLGTVDDDCPVLKHSSPLVKTPIGVKFTSIVCGRSHTLAISGEGDIYSWGLNKFGQLGHGDTNDRQYPTKIQSLSDYKVIQVSSGNYTNIALAERNGEKLCFNWGIIQITKTASPCIFRHYIEKPNIIDELKGLDVVFVDCRLIYKIFAVTKDKKLFSRRTINFELPCDKNIRFTEVCKLLDYDEYRQIHLKLIFDNLIYQRKLFYESWKK